MARTITLAKPVDMHELLVQERAAFLLPIPQSLSGDAVIIPPKPEGSFEFPVPSPQFQVHRIGDHSEAAGFQWEFAATRAAYDKESAWQKKLSDL